MQPIIYAIAGIVGLWSGLQIAPSEWKLLSFRYHYPIGKGQLIGYLFSLTLLSGLFAPLHSLSGLVCSIPAAFIFEALLSKKAPASAAACWLFRLAAAALFALLLGLTAGLPWQSLLFAMIGVGVFLRISPFGIPYPKNLCLAYRITMPAPIWGDIPPTAQPQLRRFVVTEHGVNANVATDQTDALNALIDEVGRSGGGILFFPAGRYEFHTDGIRFIQINHSHLYLEGETDCNGNPLAELICCGKTAVGRKNPWLSPFFITTGEALQPSNEFFGLQFRHRKQGFSQSNSLSDPGTDGEILTPAFATEITADAMTGDTCLKVADSSKVGKYIMVGLYNTTPDGNLIKDILGVEQLRKEWTIAHRAGAEQAPSYQWLVEVKRVIDNETIELVRPLLRDIEQKYTPAIYNVEMLEDICISNLKLSSRWNGRFRHHGFPLYYSVQQAQEMDYGWNAINMKRVAHGRIERVKILNFTNPLYVLDSRNIIAQLLEISGYDGHQGIKIYQHATDNLFQQIVFRAHFADMMGGEGNAYGNIFREIAYVSPVFKPVDFDFHGFSEGPMSPPSDNLFSHIYGFRCLKGAGSITHLPSMAQRNRFCHLECRGERRGESFYYAMTYRPKTGLLRLVTALGFAAAMAQKKRNLSPTFFLKNVKEKLQNIDCINTPRPMHKQFFTGTQTEDIDTWCKL